MLNISPDFNMDDIRKIREFNSQKHLKMTDKEREEETKKVLDWFSKEMNKPINNKKKS